MKNVLTMDNVSKSYKGRALYSNVSLSIEEGKIHAIEGPNGSGKSVLLKLMCQFVRPSEGVVQISSEYLSKDRTFPESFGVIIDRPGFIGGATGFDNLMRLASIRGKIGDVEVCEALERVGLDPSLRQKVRNYSLGMKQKLALAQSFMENQRVLILDEPFNALDADTVLIARSLIKDFRDEGRTIVFTSHNSEDIELLAERRFQINGSTVQERLGTA